MQFGTPSAERPFPSSHLLILAALTLFAFAIRWNGVDSMLPHRVIGDERVFVASLARIRHTSDHPAYSVWFGYYPEAIPALASLIPEGERTSEQITLSDRLAGASRHLFVLRAVCALLATLAIPATFFLARRLLSSAQALWAAAIVGVSLLHVWYSQQARPHAPSTALYVLAVLFCCRVLTRGTLGSYLASGLTIGCAVGTIQSGVFVVPPLVVAHFLGHRYRSKRPWWFLAVALTVVAILVRAFYPFAFDSPLFGTPMTATREVNFPERTDFMPSAVGIVPENFTGEGFATMARALADFDPLVVAFALLGLLGAGMCAGHWLRAVRTTPGAYLETLVVLAFLLPYLLVFGLFDFTYQRYVVALLPFLALGIVWGVTNLWAAIRSAPVRKLLAASLVLSIGIQAYAAAHLSCVRSADDTQEQAARWIERNIQDENARIALMPPLDLPVARTLTSLAVPSHLSDPVTSPWTAYQSRVGLDRDSFMKYRLETMPIYESDGMAELLADPAAFVESLDADYLVVEVYDQTRHRPALRKLRERAQSSKHLLARFTPCAVDRGDATPFMYRDQYNEYPEVGNWAMRSLCMERMGPVIEIYGPAR